MRIQGGYNPYAYQQQRAATKNTSFAEHFIAARKENAAAVSKSEMTAPEPLEKHTEKTQKFLEDMSSWRIQVAAYKPVAENYPASLSPEQIEDLKSRYDIANLEWPSHESAALGEELFELGIIDDDQRKFFYGLVKYTPRPAGFLVQAGEGIPIQFRYERKPEDMMIDILMNELAVQQENIDFLKILQDDPNQKTIIFSSESGGSISDHISWIENYKSQYQNIYEILSALK